MPESRTGVSAFETRLAAMDRRLRELQEELAPAREPAPDPDMPAPVHNGVDGEPAPRASRRPAAVPMAAAATPGPVGGDELLRTMYTRLLASMRELMAGYEMVAGLGTAPPSQSEVAVSAGPFSGTGALRDFERALSELPGVRSVSLRGYDADDRAVWDVQLR